MPDSIRSLLRVVIIYLIVAGLWVTFSDTILFALDRQYGLPDEVATYKGLAFVFVTTVLLFVVLIRELRRREQEWQVHLEDKEKLLEEKNNLLSQLQGKNEDLLDAYEKTIRGWSLVLEKRNREVKDHSRRVTALAERLARHMGVEDSEIIHIRRGALLHDIGKMAIPDTIILKNGNLGTDDWSEIRRHPLYGFEMLSEIEFLRPAMDIVLCHHEKWNGEGYPFGLAGDQIPLYARIFSVVDVWDALLADDRPYRSPETPETAADYLREQAGVQFDPEIVDTFLNLLEQDPSLLNNVYIHQA